MSPWGQNDFKVLRAAGSPKEGVGNAHGFALWHACFPKTAEFVTKSQVKHWLSEVPKGKSWVRLGSH